MPIQMMTASEVTGQPNEGAQILKPELKISEERVNKSGKREVNIIHSLGGSKASRETYAVEVYYVFDDEHKLKETKLMVNSPRILRVLREIVISHPTVATDFLEPFTMGSPFQMLIHHWDELFQGRDTLDDDEDRLHLNVLLEFMEVDLGKVKAELSKEMAAGRVKYLTLWALFRPGDLAVKLMDGHPWLLKIKKTAYEESKVLGPYLEILCAYTDYDGTDVGVASHEVKITQKRSFGQENPANIVDLPIYPRKYFTEGSSLETRLITRGGDFLKYQGIHIRYYDSQAYYLRDYPPDFYHPDMEYFDHIWLHTAHCGRVIIDRKTFQEEYLPVVVQPVANVQDADKLLCPPFILGYSLGQKLWCRFFVSKLEDPGWKENAFERVILPGKKLELIRALVHSHKPVARARDQTQQKGRGLIIMLYGLPGTGKTMTAECAAEETQRALLNVSLPELNKWDRVSSFERLLKDILQFATTWNAVVLFDEADVFLQGDGNESTGNSSSKRTTLVAVFLRHLEYFSGIAFLTTNRMKAFDSAMKSRIHLTIEYPTPTVASQAQIWSNALLTVPPDERDLDVNGNSHLWARENLNGRQIANAVHTAHSLARFSKDKLQKAHVDAIIQTWRDLETELQQNASTNGLQAASHTRHGSFVDEELKRLNI